MYLSPEIGSVRSPSSDFGKHVWSDSGRTPPDPIKSNWIRTILARSGWISGWIRSYPAELRPFWPDQWLDPVISGRIPAILARSGWISGRIRSDLARFLQDSAGIRWPDSNAAWFRTIDYCQIRVIGYQACVQG